MKINKNIMKNIGLIGCILFLFTLIVIDLLIFWGVQELWNWIAPLFWKNAPILTYWQAAGCVILLEIIGSFFKTRTINT